MKIKRNYLSLIISLLAVIILAAWPLITKKPADRETAFTILKAIALASSLNIILGYTGYVSFGHIVYFGIGGYTGFYLISQQGISLFAAMLIGGLSSGVMAFLLGKAILRLRGAYFALETIGVNQAIRAFVNNFDLFDGPIGMMMSFKIYQQYGGVMKALELVFYYMIALSIIAVLISYWVRTSKFGLGLLAIREDEDAAEVMDIVAPNAKTWAYVLSAIVPGLIGVLFFLKNANIEPHDTFPLHTSVELIVMVMLGGQGTIFGPILGAAGYQSLRGYLLTSPFFMNIQLSVAGVLLMLIVLFIPAGVIGWVRNRFPNTRRVLQ